MRVARLLYLSLLLSVVAACAAVPFTQRRQVMPVSETQEIGLGIELYREILRQSILNHDIEANRIIRRVGERIARSANKPNYFWEFVVIDDPDMVTNTFTPHVGGVARSVQGFTDEFRKRGHRAFASDDGPAFRKRIGIPLDAFVVGHVGRLAPEKNLRFLAETVACFLRVNEQAHFLAVGVGPSREGMQKTLEAYGLTDRLHLMGVLGRQELASHGLGMRSVLLIIVQPFAK